ncbi:MAG: biotin--[acetyl-CoA-carboxylase] ligase [Acidobacteriota bacterium]|nr:biotin--[acetyl-CoA-carboxylase] ligase [Acidobacteriota bacterium]
MLPDEVSAALSALRARRPDVQIDLRWHASATSTMDLASELALSGASHGVVVGADEQSAGRGRRGHEWQSPAGAGLYFSMVTRSSLVSTSLPLLTLAAGVGVREGIRAATGLAADLKWPNDVMIGRRKLAGILAEGLALGTREQAVIIGVGLNLQPAAYSPDVAARATSLEGELGRAIDRGTVLGDVLAGLWDSLAALERNRDDILQAWRAASPSSTGTRVERDMTHGTTAGIDDAGALLVRTADGMERIIAGELQWHL